MTAIALGIASAAQHLHAHGIMHGDLYAHNTLVDGTQALFGDFGAATTYGLKNEFAQALQKIEVRAWGCLLEDLMERTDWTEIDSKTKIIFEKLKTECFDIEVTKRPDFQSILGKLNYISVFK
jgi:serine/threonine protein kinase